MMNEKQLASITVDGHYAPDVVTFKQGHPAELTFERRTNTGCLDVVQSPALGFKLALPINQPQTVTIPTDQTGVFDFSCGMDMVHGKVVIEA